jgi:biotin carboxyl carrier protein
MPGKVVHVLVGKGAEVKKGAGLLVIEAMKMENELRAPEAGIIEEILISPGQTVEAGAVLLKATS